MSLTYNPPLVINLATGKIGNFLETSDGSENGCINFVCRALGMMGAKYTIYNIKHTDYVHIPAADTEGEFDQYWILKDPSRSEGLFKKHVGKHFDEISQKYDELAKTTATRSAALTTREKIVNSRIGAVVDEEMRRINSKTEETRKKNGLAKPNLYDD